MRSWVVVLAAVVLGSSPAAADVLDQAPFTATPTELLAAARPALTTDAPVVLLRDDATVTLDDAGRATTRYRMVGVIVKPAAVDDWGTLTLQWRPFYQDRPTIRVRVVAPSGQVTELDPALISDTPVQSESASVFSDRRRMEAPLPRLAVGAVFEEEFVIADREPLLGAGWVDRLFVGRSVPVQRMIVTIDAPAKHRPRVAPRGFATPPTPRQVTRGGRATWTYDLAAVAIDDDHVFAVPGDVAAYRSIGYATAPSWAAVAADYARVVAERTGAPVPLPADLRAATPRATVDRAVAWLHANVRYTGIELGDSAIIPWPPAQTLARGFGDCKDKAALLVAVLRAAGIEADLALLSTGPGTDVDRTLPGMGAFDHAIVRARVDGQDLWIDATEDGLPAGQLPLRDQGRLVLVIAPSTRDLVLSPRGAPADNLVREVRTYRLAELDGGAVTEVTREHGIYDDNLRRWVRDTTQAELTKHMTSYALRQYSGELVRVTGTPAPAVTAPFDLTVEIGKVGRAFTKRDQIDVYLDATDTTTRVPDTFTDKNPEIDATLATRTMDYAWSAPHVYEIENRLILPPGYVAPTLTARERRVLGTMTLTTTRRLERDTLIITYRLDTGKVRISPAEARATRAAMLALRAEDREHVLIAQTGATLMHAGKLVEAIAEYRRLIALHPKEAVHHGQLAEAYRQAGMIAAARRAAQQGVTVEPTNADAYALLGFHLRRDSVGREHGFDADRAGALAAYRKALTLMPTHIGALEDLASLLAVDAHGWPSSSPRDLREAVELLRRARTASDDTTYDQRIVEALLRAGDFAEAEAAARKLPEGEDRAELLVTAVAAQRGGVAATELATSLAAGAARTRVLTNARGWLMRVRRYDAVRAIHAAIGAAPDPALDKMAAQLAVTDFTKLAPTDPLTPVRLATIASMGLTPPSTPWDRAVAADLAEVARGVGPNMARFAAPSVAIDVVLSLMVMTVEGDATDGWRVEVESVGNRMVYYVALVKGRARLVGLFGMPAGLGDTLLGALARKDVGAATRFLERAAADVQRQPTIGPVAGAMALYQGEVGTGRPTRELVEVVGAMMVAADQPKVALPILRRCALVQPVSKAVCREALADVLRDQSQWAELATVARQLPTTDGSDARRRAELLAGAGAGAEAVADLDQALTRTPDDLSLLMSRALLAIDVAGWDAAQPWLVKVAAHADAESRGMFNNLAWLHLFYDATPDQALALARRAERTENPLHPSLANTLAVIEAEADHPYQALQYLAKSHPHGLDAPPDDADWYAYGRIAETYGLRDDAIGFYRRIAPAPRTLGLPSTYDFAARALARLGAATPPRP